MLGEMDFVYSHVFGSTGISLMHRLPFCVTVGAHARKGTSLSLYLSSNQHCTILFKGHTIEKDNRGV